MVPGECRGMNRHIVYKCDPEKNTVCRKSSCQTYCFLTTYPEFSSDGIPMYFDPVTGETKNVMERGQFGSAAVPGEV